VALDAAARTQLLVGRPDRAAALLDRALASGGADPSVVSALRLQRARCELARFRPDLALEWLTPLLDKPATVPSGWRNELDEAAAAARSIPAASWQRVSPGLRLAGEEAAAALVAAARDHPDDPVAALYAGRALLLAGRAGDALPLLARAEGSGRLGGPWVGPSRMLAGQAADLLGRRAAALTWYRKALESPDWVGREAPRQWLTRPYRGEAPS
jgi:tetratricopeptide (TPR) repeat protein